jgi:hypothetical protein
MKRIAGPVLIGAYGIIRIISHHHAPGIAWTLGHVCFGLGMLAFIPVLRMLRRLAGARISGAILEWLGYCGIAALVIQAVIDIWVAGISADRTVMNGHYQHIQSIAGVNALVYTVVPVFFYIGFLGLAVLAAVRHKVGPMAPLLVLTGIALAASSLDLLPVAAACFAVALLPAKMEKWTATSTLGESSWSRV